MCARHNQHSRGQDINTFGADEGSVLVIAGLVCSHFQLQFEMETGKLKEQIYEYIYRNIPTLSIQ